MPLTVIPLPYGLRDVKVKVMPAGSETPSATAVDFPNARTFSFSEAEEFTELRGDDGLVAVHGQGPAIDWELEGGGCSLEFITAIFGGVITETGTTPAQKKSYKKNATATTGIRPYFQVEGQAISDSGGDFHVIIYKARATGEMSGEMADGAFWLTGASGRALPKANGDLYELVQNETAVAIT